APKQTADFLAGLKYDNRPALVENLAKIRQNFELMQFQMKLASKLRNWPNLGVAEQGDIIKQIGTIIKAGEATPEKLGLLMDISDMIGEGPSAPLAGKMLADVLP